MVAVIKKKDQVMVRLVEPHPIHLEVIGSIPCQGICPDFSLMPVGEGEGHAGDS